MINNDEAAQRGYSTTGRPRRLTDSQVAEIVQWHRSKITNAEMAARYGIARGTLENIIRTNGQHYKQASPENRTEALHQQRARRAERCDRDWF